MTAEAESVYWNMTRRTKNLTSQFEAKAILQNPTCMEYTISVYLMAILSTSPTTLT
jgi:hypothetical protein